MRRLKGLIAKGAVGTPAQHKANLRAALNAQNAKPYGTAEGKIRDANWENDLSDITARTQPHTINVADPVTGASVPKLVSVKPDTIVAHLDDNGEVVGWSYVED